MCKNLAEELMEKKIVTIMRGVTGEKALYAADAIAKGGLQFLEVTFDPSGRISQRETLETIAALSKEFGSILHIGAGTVLTVDQVEAAHEAGAGYIISPDTDEKIIHRTKECGMLSLPGALTPTEIKRAHGAGADFVKLFPVGNQEGIEQLLLKNSIKEEDIYKILASGMITSEFGLCNVDHIIAPVGIKELHDNMYETKLEEITGIPFVFIRGVKIMGQSVDETDVIRGEETELIGIMEDAESAYILPGSHSKIIKTDTEGRIITFSTSLTGEMIAVLSSGTILKDAVNLNVNQLDAAYLLDGYRCCERNGINKALFKVRLLKTQFQKSETQIYSFFMGIILHDEIEEVLRYDVKKIVIAGKKQIKEALSILIQHVSEKEIVCVTDEQAENANIRGMIKIYEYA